MRHLPESLERCSPYTVGRRIRRDEGRELRFNSLQRSEKPVIVSIWNDRSIEYIVAMSMRPENRAQTFC